MTGELSDLFSSPLLSWRCEMLLLSSTNIRDYVYKGKCLLPVQETGYWWASGVWQVSLHCKQVMGEGCVWKRNGERDSFHLVFLVK